MEDQPIYNSNESSLKINRLCFNFFIFFGIAFFTTSLFIPAFFTSDGDILGFWVFITGWIGVIFIQLGWFANPINLLALLLAREKPRMALLLSFLAFVIALGALLIYEIPIGINYEKIFIKEYGLGLYLWLAAHTFLMLAMFFNFLNANK